MRIKIEDLPPEYRKQVRQQMDLARKDNDALLEKGVGITPLMLGSKKLKYKNKPCEWNGIKFRSQKERDYAIKLEVQKNNKLILEWAYEVPYNLNITCKMCGYKGDKVAKIVPDFTVTFPDGVTQIAEIKQEYTKTPVWRLKWKLFKILYPQFEFKVIDK